jgi:hypothetical protein
MKGEGMATVLGMAAKAAAMLLVLLVYLLPAGTTSICQVLGDTCMALGAAIGRAPDGEVGEAPRVVHDDGIGPACCCCESCCRSLGW